MQSYQAPFDVFLVFFLYFEFEGTLKSITQQTKMQIKQICRLRVKNHFNIALDGIWKLYQF